MAHFRAVAAATELPIMIYNNPISYGIDITPAMLAELADEPRFVAVKESSGNVLNCRSEKSVRRPLPNLLRCGRPDSGKHRRRS